MVSEISLGPIALGLSFQQYNMEEEWWRRGLVTLRELGRSGGGALNLSLWNETLSVCGWMGRPISAVLLWEPSRLTVSYVTPNQPC